MTKILEIQLQFQSLQWIFRVDSFRINWFGILAAQRTLKSILQHFGSCNYLPVSVSPTQGVGLNYFASLLLLSISLWFLLYIFSCRKPFLLVFRAFLYQYLCQCWEFYKKLSLHSFSYHLYWIHTFLTFQCLKLEALRKTKSIRAASLTQQPSSAMFHRWQKKRFYSRISS